jgi:DNA mismatch repair endonuclease MutH
MHTFESKQDLLEFARKAIGIRLGDIDKTNRLSTKGGVGHVMEEGYFGYPINNKSEADFLGLNVELKATPFKRGKRITAKERLVLNIINYMKESSLTFETSSFWTKNQSILMMFYEHIDNLPKSEWSIAETILYEYPEEDLIIIKDDWEKIISKIREGKAHEISEGMTHYLGACTKGSTSEKSFRQQPHSEIPAKQRAFSLKQSYMNYVLNNYVFGDKTDSKITKYPNTYKTFPSKKNIDEKIIVTPELLNQIDFESFLLAKLKPYIGRSQASLVQEFGLSGTSKDTNELIISRILGMKGRVSQSVEFKKANIKLKTIRVNKDGTGIKESMSFPTFKFTEIVSQSWEESDIYQLLFSSKFLFAVFQFNHEKDLILKDILFWNMPATDIEEVRKVWLIAKQAIRKGLVLTKTPRGMSSNLPKQKDSHIAHVRPHGANAADTYPLPDGRVYTKQCFWLNNSYIFEQINKK